MHQPPDVLALRLSKELKRLHEPAEALIPFTPNASGIAEWVVEHVYVRGLNGSLRKIADLPGIEFIRKEHAPDGWIGQLLKTESQHKVIRKGSHVRLLVGPCARMCGEVIESGCELVVQIQMRTKQIKVHVSPEHVQAIDNPFAFFA